MTCGDQEHVQGGSCVVCPAGTRREPGDDPSGADTTCAPLTCRGGERVQGHACVPCSFGEIRPEGDDASGGDTSCLVTSRQRQFDLDRELRCELTLEGAPRCYGRVANQLQRLPAGWRLQGLEVELGKVCGLSHDGSPHCWFAGEAFERFLSKLTEPLIAFDAMGTIYCGVEESGRLVCHGPREGFQVESNGPFVDVVVGVSNICALDATGRAQCFNQFEASAPELDERFAKVEMWDIETCGIHVDGHLECWTAHPDRARFANPPEGAFVDLVMHDDYACALRTDGEICCWGSSTLAPPIVEPQIPLVFERGPYQAIALGTSGACAQPLEGELECIGYNMWGHLRPSSPMVQELFVSHHIFELGAQGEVTCVTCSRLLNKTQERLDLLSLEGLADLQASDDWTCARYLGGEVLCVGPDQKLTSFSQRYHTFRIAGDGTIHGVTLHGTYHKFSSARTGAPRSGSYVDMVGPCLRTGLGEIDCDVREGWRARLTPGVFYEGFATSESAVCGRTKAGEVHCQSLDEEGNVEVLDGVYRQLFSYDSFRRQIVGLTQDGEITTLRDEGGLLTVWPQGRFERLSSQEGSTLCGIRRDGSYRCTGRLLR